MSMVNYLRSASNLSGGLENNSYPACPHSGALPTTKHVRFGTLSFWFEAGSAACRNRMLASLEDCDHLLPLLQSPALAYLRLHW